MSHAVDYRRSIGGDELVELLSAPVGSPNRVEDLSVGFGREWLEKSLLSTDHRYLHKVTQSAEFEAPSPMVRICKKSRFQISRD